MNAATLPTVLAQFSATALVEFCFYQDMLIKLPDGGWIVESRLQPLSGLIGLTVGDFFATFGHREYAARHIYLTVKRLPQQAGIPINRPGWHCDGFRTDDITYIWSDNTPTEFSTAPFDLLGDEHSSMVRMEEQAKLGQKYAYPDGRLIRMDAACVHRPGLPTQTGVRTFVKVSFSRDRFNLEGNAINPLLNPGWKMRPRGAERNVPQER